MTKMTEMTEKQTEAVAKSKIVEFIAEWRKSPLRFVRECIGAKPTEQQKSVLLMLERWGVRVAVKSCHGSGKSTLIAWIILWALVCFNDVKIAVTAPTSHQLEDVITSEVEKWRSRMPEFFACQVTVTSKKIYVKGMSGFAVLRTGRKETPEALQGFHADNMLFLIDEASGIDEKVFEVAQGSLTSKNSTILMFANPTRTSGYFFNAFNKNRDSWTRFTFSALDSPNVEQSFIDSVRDEYGEDSDMFRVRVLGEFPNESDLQFIPNALIEAAAGKQFKSYEFDFAPKILGVDVAMFGGDRSVIAMRQGLFSDILFTARGIKPEDLASKVVQLAKEHKADGVVVDATGIGESVLCALRMMNFSAFAFYAAGASKSAQCMNARMDCWWRMREWLRSGGAIPPNDDLRSDLAAPEYGYNTKGKMQLEKKESIRDRGLASPDFADALALTFAFDIAKAVDGACNVHEGVIDDGGYNPLEW